MRPRRRSTVWAESGEGIRVQGIGYGRELLVKSGALPVVIAILSLARPCSAETSCDFILEQRVSDAGISSQYVKLVESFCSQGDLDQFRRFVAEMKGVGAPPPNFFTCT